MKVQGPGLAGISAGIVTGLFALCAPFSAAAQPPDAPLTSAGGESVAADRAPPPASAPDDNLRPAPAGLINPHPLGKAVSFRRLLVALAPGQAWGAVETGRFCFGSRPLTWSATSAEMKTPQFIAAFRAKFEEAGVKVAVAAGPGTPLPSNVYNVYGLVTQLSGDFCLPQAADMDTIKGRVTLAVQWRLFAPLGHEPLATVATTADYRRKTLGLGGVEGMLDAVFAQNLDELLETPEVVQALAPQGAHRG